MKLSIEQKAKIIIGMGAIILAAIVALLGFIIVQIFKIEKSEDSKKSVQVIENNISETIYDEEEIEEKYIFTVESASPQIEAMDYSIVHKLCNIEHIVTQEKENIIEVHQTYRVYTSSKDIIKDKYDPDDEYFGWGEENYKYLLMTIVGEAQCCSYEEQIYVGSVVLNRLVSDRFSGNTIKDIVLAKNQYACFDERYKTAYREPTQENINATLELLQYGSMLPSNVVFQSLFEQGSGVYLHMPDTGTYFCYIT